MANQVDFTIIEEGHRNAIVRIAAFIDTLLVSMTPAFAVTNFTNNDPNQSRLIGFRIDSLQFAIDPDIVVRLYWNSSGPQLIATITDSNELNFKKDGGLIPNMQLSGYDGSINLSTAGYTPGNSTGFSLIMRMVKLYLR